MKEHILICPSCESEYDFSEDMLKWKIELLRCSKVLDQIKELYNLKGGNNNNVRNRNNN